MGSQCAENGDEPGTPRAKRLDGAAEATPERPGAVTRSRKRLAELFVVESVKPKEQPQATARPATDRFLAPRPSAAFREPQRKVPRVETTTLDQLAEDFADDYFGAPRSARPPRGGASIGALLLGTKAGKDAGAPGCQTTPTGSDCVGAKARGAELPRERWLGLMQLGFSLLIQGAGSKQKLLEAFADEVLLPWGASVVRIDGYNKRLSLVECLRDVLDRLHPGTPPGVSMESLLAAIRSARAAAPSPVRPLCFVVHSMDVMSEAQQGCVATLAAMPGVHLVASVDSIWAPLAWQARALRDFNFVHVLAHTYEEYTAEVAARYAGGRPAWSDPNSDRHEAPRASVGLVLRSLTQCHRELVEAIAQHQLEVDGRAGISKSKLLNIASERMIAANVAKLTTMLNELRDHEVVAQRNASDGGTLIYLPYDSQTMRRLAELSSRPFDEESEDEEDAQSEHGGS